MNVPKFNKEQLDFIEDRFFNSLFALSMEFKRHVKEIEELYQKTRAQMDALRDILRNSNDHGTHTP
jgi:hypothetical protein